MLLAWLVPPPGLPTRVAVFLNLKFGFLGPPLGFRLGVQTLGGGDEPCPAVVTKRVL